ncbi:hypothetical protein UK99_01245 [Frankia casuarinae]|uniref:hypothetical protein n=1 Tax=Frankia casuarinae (strain DSM 45818 / CECT 9043 / HFP020203 / CcI3) TaxID=106370 RepID=UPI000A107129|nr:hypothetical protein [Frankia casuarinae]ORT98491.1 hypothetical protein UK99_01245 [Frankia casuarinae]
MRTPWREAQDVGVETRPVLVGPVTFLLLAKSVAGAPGGFRALELLGSLVEQYARLLADLAAAGVGWAQLGERR